MLVADAGSSEVHELGNGGAGTPGLVGRVEAAECEKHHHFLIRGS